MFGVLQEALEIQHSAYDSDLHVNVAATLHQLGIVASTKGELGAARSRLEDALRIRRSLYRNQAAHHEVCQNPRAPTHPYSHKGWLG